ncbi:MAG TPA: hypothetical protein VN761_12300, partial [Candidatus Polarisedimenticolia bacterium]|nr:hypothetical protein [Candidatus Polarisedimenticolia bacterium]
MKILPVLLTVTLLTLNTLAASIDIIGGTLLHQVDPTLQGAGIPVAQAEADNTSTPNSFEVDPAGVGQPQSLFTWISTLGTATVFPNTVGSFSSHAEFVANEFYGFTNGVANQVSHVYNYSSDYFYNQIIVNSTPISALVVNQSFIFDNADGSHLPTNQEKMIDVQYDDFAVKYGVLFVSGAGNGG